MKVSMAALLVLILTLTVTSAFHSQTSYCWHAAEPDSAYTNIWRSKGRACHVICLHTLSVPLVFVNFALRTKDVNITVCEVLESVNLPHICCLKYHEKVLPRKLVAGYRKALNCNLPAIIFVTKKNREICTNPNNKWVQDYIKDPNLPLLPPRNLAQARSIRS